MQKISKEEIMICFPNAKINIGLNITEKRADGYHNLETIFYPTTLCDALEILEDKNLTTPYEWSSTGIEVDAKPEDNLCIKALMALKTDFDIPPIKIHLHKNIPFGAGIGGGSADAAFTLITLNEMFQLELSHEQLIKYASKIGADCAFFIINKPCFAEGIGNELSKIELSLKGYHLVLAKPQVHVSTAEAYSGVTPKCPKHKLIDTIEKEPSHWKETVCNDFEPHILEAHPEIKSVKEYLYQAGAEYASMTGSGAAVFGVFKNKPTIDLPHCFVWQEELSI